LYNKEAFLEFVLREGRFRSERTSVLEVEFDHLRGMKDAIPANVSWIQIPSDSMPSASEIPLFSCPATELKANGIHPFRCIWRCGCIVSERALMMASVAAFSSSSSASLTSLATVTSDCPWCGQLFDRRRDVVEIYPADGGASAGEKLKRARQKKTDLASSTDMRVGRSTTVAQGCAGVMEESRLTLQQNAISPSPASSVGAGALKRASEIAAAASLAAKRKKQKKRPRELNQGAETETVLRQSLGNPATGLKDAREGWERRESKSKPGKFYYCNDALRATQWEPPPCFSGRC
jgi:hypothetical protein